MSSDSLAMIAGIVSSSMFVSSHIPMLLKAHRTGDLHSYSLLNLIMVNTGNLIYWLYVSSLPVGPIWVLHTFYTVSSALLLVMYYQMLLRGYANRRQSRVGRGQVAEIFRYVRTSVHARLTSTRAGSRIDRVLKPHPCGVVC